MKNEINPLVFWGALGVAIVGILAFLFFRMRTPSNFETTGSEKQIENVQKGGTFYQPPPGAPVPGAAGAPGGAPQGGLQYPMGVPTSPPGTAPGQ